MTYPPFDSQEVESENFVSLEFLREQEFSEEENWNIYKNYAGFDDPDELENW